MSYAVIKNEEIICFSDEIPTLKSDAIFGEDGEIIKEAIEGMDFDRCVRLEDPYDYKKEYQYIGGKIVISEKPIEQPKKPTKEEILAEIGKLSLQKAGMIELGEDTTGIEAQIATLKEEYNAIVTQ